MPTRAVTNVATRDLNAFPTTMPHNRRLASTACAAVVAKPARREWPAKLLGISAADARAPIIDAMAVAVRFEPMLPCRSMGRQQQVCVNLLYEDVAAPGGDKRILLLLLRRLLGC
jgi:hypothetical protein